MANLTSANSTYSAGPIDTYTAVADGNDGSEILAQHINGALSAIVAIEGDIGVGEALKRDRSTLAARLDTSLDANGAINKGTAFPSSPTPVLGQPFYRTDLDQLYIYDSTSQWKRIDGVNDHGLLGGLGDDDHSQYLNTARHDVTARHGKSVLPSAIAYEDEANVFTANQRINAGLGVNVAPPSTGEIATSGGIDAGNNGVFLKTKVIDIGDWNMDTTATKDVAHGLTLSSVRSVEAYIRNDDGTFVDPLNFSNASGSANGRGVAGTTNVNLERLAGGDFDNTNFDATSYNRGWIIIRYV